MSILIRNATIVTGGGTGTVLHDGALAIEGGRIVAVGPTESVVPQYPHAEIVDGRGKAVFPGLINCHTHLCLTAWRGIQEDFGFPSILRFPVTVRAFMSREENAVFAMLGAVEALRSGNTTLLEIGARHGRATRTRSPPAGCASCSPTPDTTSSRPGYPRAGSPTRRPSGTRRCSGART